MSVTFTLTPEQQAAISLVAVNVEDWCSNVIVARAAAALQDLRQQPQWSETLSSALAAGVNVQDEAAVLRHGLTIGIVKTAAQREAERMSKFPRT